MIDPKTENKLNRRTKKQKKGRYGMIVNYAGRKLAEILKNKQERNAEHKDQ